MARPYNKKPKEAVTHPPVTETFDQPTTYGEGLVTNELSRQFEKGYNPVLDAKYVESELERASIAYILATVGNDGSHTWPFHPDSFKPSQDKVRNLTKAAALLIARINALKYTEEPTHE